MTVVLRLLSIILIHSDIKVLQIQSKLDIQKGQSVRREETQRQGCGVCVHGVFCRQVFFSCFLKLEENNKDFLVVLISIMEQDKAMQCKLLYFHHENET